MQFDVFFSISQTPVAGHTPDERTMFANWLAQVEAADRLGFGVAWLAESHLSSEVQKRNQHPVVPHWQGEIGLNCDMLQSAHLAFQRTAVLAAQEQAFRHAPAVQKARRLQGDGGLRHGRIEVGSAVMNILQGGGPIAAAERIAYFAALADLDERPGGMSRKPDGSPRRIHVGFSAGRFDYMNRAHGYVPRDVLESAVPYPLLKGKWFHEATEIFVRLLAGETLASDDVPMRTIARADCRSDEDWQRIRAAGKQAGVLRTGPGVAVLAATAAGGAGQSVIPVAPHDVEATHGAGGDAEHVVLPKRFVFEELKIVPHDWRRDLVQLVAGSHDPSIAELANRWLPCQVANLSITPPAVIEATHERMAAIYHKDGGPWTRDMMPRTVMVFLNEEPGLDAAERTAAAQQEAKAALSAYWTALEGTLDPAKVENAADNAVIGNAEEVASQVAARYHADDRLMLWFDFFNHDSARVVRNMEAWMGKVAPALV